MPKSVEAQKTLPPYVGVHKNRIDNKGRIPFPKRLRKILEERKAERGDTDSELTIYVRRKYIETPEGAIDKVIRIEDIVKRGEHYQFERAVLDRQGRFVIPQALRERDSFSNDGVYRGRGEYVELTPF